MILLQRLRSAVPAAKIHFAINVLVISVCAVWIFLFMYPSPYGSITDARKIFSILVIVDVFCGPVLTLIVWDIKKSRSLLFKEIGVIALIQISALLYGLFAIVESRPVFLAFEGNRFQLVLAADLTADALKKAHTDFKKLSWTGPRLIGVRLASPTDRDYVESIRLALAGLPPAYRPERWVPYESQKAEVLKASRTVSDLEQNKLLDIAPIDDFLKRNGLYAEEIVCLPLINGEQMHWVVLLDKSSAKLRGVVRVGDMARWLDQK